MSKSNIINLNDYTLLDQGEIDNIYFYPSASLTDTKVTSKIKDICVVFEISKDKNNTKKLYCSLKNSNNEELFSSYSISLKEIESNKYVIIENPKDIPHAEVLPKRVIDFNSLDFQSFIKVLEDSNELINMIPPLTKLLEDKKNTLANKQNLAKLVNTPSSSNYFHNLLAYFVNETEKSLVDEDDQAISKSIVNQLKKNNEISIFDEDELKLSYLVIYSIILNKVKSNTLKPRFILDEMNIEIDLNTANVELEDMKNLFKALEEESNSPLNSIQNEIKKHILDSKKPDIDVVVSEVSTSSKENIRYIDELALKNSLITGLVNQDYYPLPHNQVLIYNLNKNIINFICIINLDTLYKLLKTYKINRHEENKLSIDLLKKLDNILSQNDKITKLSLTIYILNIIMLYVYYNKNIDKTLLFSKGDYILDLGFLNGNYDIKVINRETEKKYGRLTKLAEETKEAIKEALDKSEKAFNILINDIIFNSILSSITNYNLTIDIKELKHKDIIINFKNDLSRDKVDLSLPLDVLLLMVTSIKKARKNVLKAEKPIEPETSIKEEIKYDLSKEEYDFIIRKANTISTLVKTGQIDNATYQEVSILYDEFNKIIDEDIKREIIYKLKDLLNN